MTHVLGVNHLGTHGRWTFVEFTDIYEIESDFGAKVERAFDTMVDHVAAQPPT